MEPQQPMTTPPTVPTMSTNSKKPNKKTTLVLWALGALIAVGVGIIAYLLWGTGGRIDAEQPVSTITISQEGFLPNTVKVKKGQEVAWFNEDDNPHEVYADQEAAPGLDSTGPLVKGDTYVYEFEKEGTINFYDPQDPSKYKGTIIVE